MVKDSYEAVHKNCKGCSIIQTNSLIPLDTAPYDMQEISKCD